MNSSQKIILHLFLNINLTGGKSLIEWLQSGGEKKGNSGELIPIIIQWNFAKLLRMRRLKQHVPY